jgi:hypothetical protein
MKELQAGIQLLKGKGFQLNWHSLFKKRTLKPVAMKARSQQVSDRQRPLLSLPISSSLEGLRQRTTEGLRRLESQAEQINQLSTELEAAMLEFKAIASEINPDWRAIQATQKSFTSADVCEYRTTGIPQVAAKQDGSFVLRSKSVDLFQAEREAVLVAKTLRHRTRKKRGSHGGKL